MKSMLDRWREVFSPDETLTKIEKKSDFMLSNKHGSKEERLVIATHILRLSDVSNTFLGIDEKSEQK